MAGNRFATVNDDEMQRILVEKDAINTRKSTVSGEKLFRSYLREREQSEDFENFNTASLDKILCKFYVEVRQENGEKYKKSSLSTIRHAINRFLSNSNIDIVNGLEFKESRRVFKAVCQDLKRDGKGGVEHFPAIESGDLNKMRKYFNTDGDESVKLLEKVFTDLMIYFGRRGRENLRNLKVADFATTKDGEGDVYVYMVRDELTKNHQTESNSAEGRMYAKPGMFYHRTE